MKLNKLLKGLLFALPAIALSGCGSTSETSTDSSATTETNASANTNATNGAQTSDTAVVTPVKPDAQISEQEALAQAKQKEEEKAKVEAEQALLKIKTVYFAFNKSTIKPEFENILKAHAAYLIATPTAKVTVEGYTDERGTPEYNIALGERRATAVSKYLQALGVPADQIAIRSFGEEDPVALGHTAEDYAKNRRAVLAR